MCFNKFGRSRDYCTGEELKYYGLAVTSLFFNKSIEVNNNVACICYMYSMALVNKYPQGSNPVYG